MWLSGCGQMLAHVQGRASRRKLLADEYHRAHQVKPVWWNKTCKDTADACSRVGGAAGGGGGLAAPSSSPVERKRDRGGERAREKERWIIGLSH